MVMLLNMGRVDRNDPQALQKAYDMAVRFNPELAATVAKETALANAARQTAAANKASEASRNVSGNRRGSAKQVATSLQEAMRMADKQASA